MVSPLAPRPSAADRARPRLRGSPGLVEPAERTALERATGRRSIPTLVLDDGTVLAGDDEILATLDRRFAEPPDAARHREKTVEEWPEWIRLWDEARLDG
jgi:glutathione S-transferase